MSFSKVPFRVIDLQRGEVQAIFTSTLHFMGTRLFFALLLVDSSPGCADFDIKAWLSAILKHEAAYCSDGILPAEWKMSKQVPVPPIYEQLHAARTAVSGRLGGSSRWRRRCSSGQDRAGSTDSMP